MLFCKRCGNSILLEDSIEDYNKFNLFTGIYNTSGWEEATVDPRNGDYYDYINGESNETDLEHYICAYCNSEDIEEESNATEKEAKDLRDEYNSSLGVLTKCKRKNEEWDN